MHDSPAVALKSGLLRAAPNVLICVLAGPVMLGLLLTVLPAFGYLPALGGLNFTLAHWQTLFDFPGLRHSVAVSLFSGLFTPLIALTCVLLFLAGASGTRLERWVQRLIAPLLAIPHAASAFGLVFLIAPSGLLARLISPGVSGWSRPPDLLIINDHWGISLMLGLIIKEIPFLLLISLAALPQLDPLHRVAMARSLGYRPVRAWLMTVLPALYPLIRLPVFAVIAFASATVDVALILGPVLPQTLSVIVLQWFNDPELRYRFVASAGALLQLGITLFALLVWRGLEGIVCAVGRWWIGGGERSCGERWLRWVGRISVAAAMIVALGGLIALALNSVAGSWRFPATLPTVWSLQPWRNVVPDFASPLANTLLIGMISTILALVMVVAVLEVEQRGARRLSSSLLLLYLPLVIPQIAFLFGFVVLTEFMHWRPDIKLVIFAHLLFVLPYVFLSLSESYCRLDPRWTQLAASLGASPWRTFWRIRLPLLAAPCLTAVAVGMAVSVGQYLATQLPGAGRVSTLTTEAVALASGGNRGVTAVWALLQALLPMSGFMLALFLPRLLWRHRRGMRGVV